MTYEKLTPDEWATKNDECLAGKTALEKTLFLQGLGAAIAARVGGLTLLEMAQELARLMEGVLHKMPTGAEVRWHFEAEPGGPVKAIVILEAMIPVVQVGPTAEGVLSRSTVKALLERNSIQFLDSVNVSELVAALKPQAAKDFLEVARISLGTAVEPEASE